MDKKEDTDFSVETGNETEDFTEPGQTTPDEDTPKPASSKPKGNIIENMYDKIPLNYKQVDIIVKVLLVVLVALLVIGIATSPVFK